MENTEQIKDKEPEIKKKGRPPRPLKEEYTTISVKKSVLKELQEIRKFSKSELIKFLLRNTSNSEIINLLIKIYKEKNNIK